MKKITQSILLAGVGMAALPAMADAAWNRPFFGYRTQSTSSVMADFTNNGFLDIYIGGNSSLDVWEGKPGVWSWQNQSNLYENNGDGTWKINSFIITEGEVRHDPVLDENGNPVLDEKGEPTYTDTQMYVMNPPAHGLPANVFSNYIPFDYNNDGLVDMLMIGGVNHNDQFGYKDALGAVPCNEDGQEGVNRFVHLFKNTGNAKFEMVAETGIPNFRNDNPRGVAMYQYSVAVGDYDRDGYNDLLVSGIYNEAQPEGYPRRLTALYRNVNGTGKFERMDIAETKGGVWTKDIKDEEGNIVVEKKELPGFFLPISGNAFMADINNDGWLDVVVSGWADKSWDGVVDGGAARTRVYLNQEGKKFVDVTSETPNFTQMPRNGACVVSDFDADGYFDFMVGGYMDGGIGFNSRLFYNESAYGSTVYDSFVDKSIFKEPNGNELNYDWYEKCRALPFDFNGDGIQDLLLSGCSDSWIFYGTVDGSFVREEQQRPSRGFSGHDTVDGCGDVNNDGLVDFYRAGYVWDGDWRWGGELYQNATEVTVDAPAAPTNVAAIMENGSIKVTWEDNDDVNSAYNITLQKPNGEFYSIIPVDPATGFIKTGELRTPAVRPGVKEYTIKAEAAGEYTVGVQAVSLLNSKASNVVTAKLDGVEAVSVSDIDVTVNGNSIIVNAATNVPVKVINTLGQVVASGFANTPIVVEAEGVLFVSADGTAKKIVK